MVKQRKTDSWDDLPQPNQARGSLAGLPVRAEGWGQQGYLVAGLLVAAVMLAVLAMWTVDYLPDWGW